MKNVFPILLFLAAFLPQTHATTWYVKTNGSDANNGTSWNTAFKSIQKALNVAAASGDQIWIAGGVYHATQGIGPDPKFWYWDITKGVSIYGHFNGTETSLAERTVANPITILSGDMGNDDLNQVATEFGDIQGDNANYLIFVKDVTQTTRFDGLVFTGTYNPGSQTLGGVNVYGGGTHVSFTNCLFSGNYNGDNGALSIVSGSFTSQPCSPTISNCIFEHNGSNDMGYSSGTGKSIDVRMYADGQGGQPEFTACWIRNNNTYDLPSVSVSANVPNCKATWMTCNFENNFCANSNLSRGGALATFGVRLECISCTFTNNSAGIHGGAVYCANAKGNNTPQFVACVFTGNHAGFDGGALAIEGCDVNMVSSTFSGNSCDRNGGAVALVYSSYNPAPATFLVRYSNFWQNTASENGGGFYINDPNTSFILKYCMISGNSAASGGALYWDITENTNISCGLLTCIVDGNSANEGGAFSIKRSSGTASQAFVLNSCTVYGNSNNGAIFNDNHVVDCTNTILWGNGLPEFTGSGTNKASWSLFESPDCASAGINGACTNNIFGRAPLFVNAAGGDFHSQMCSPAVNNGNDINIDYDQNARPFPGDRADIGAFEYQGNPATISYRDNDGDGYGITGAGNIRHTCTPPPGFAAQVGDCNDNDASINPGATEVCDGKDNNCNNLTDYLDPTYVDAEPPTFITAVPANLSLSCADQVPPPATLTATDNCTPNPTVTFSTTTTRSNNPNDCAYYTYTITRTWTAKDLKNNTAALTQVISVKDEQPPVFTAVSPNVTAGCDQPVPGYAQPSAVDNCSLASITLQTTSDRSADPSDCAYYTYTITRTWTAADRCGNTATAQQIVSIQDNKPPFVPLPPAQQVVVECDQAIPQITFLGSQDCDAHPILSVTESSEEFQADPYDHVFQRIKRHITLTDHCGNAAEFDQVLNVRDVQPPHISNCPADLTVNGTEDGALVDFPAANVTDNCGYELYYTPYEPGGSLFPLGVTQMYIDAYDRGGNYTSCAFKVTVKDGFKVHCQDPVFATVLAGTSPDNNAVAWNPPYAEPCSFCDDQQADPQFQQRFKPLGKLHGHSYFLSNQKLPAGQAASLCAQYGGYLTSIGSSTENRMLTNELAGQAALIGLSDAANEGVFTWSDGQVSAYQNWAVSQPNANPAAAAILDYTTIAAGGKWQNVGADSAYFILEIPCYDVKVLATNFPGNSLAPVGQYEVQYQVKDHCGRTEECVQPVSVSRERKSYCLPNLYPDALDRDTSLWIQKVQIGAFTQNTGNNYGYSRHTATPNTTLTAGETTPITINLGSSTGTTKAYVHVWLDANADRDFYDAGEVLLDTFITTGQLSFTALIPANAAKGDLRQRLRVAVSRYYAPEACGDYVNGETEDYRVAISAGDVNRYESTDRNTLAANALLFPNPASTEAFLNLSEFEGQSCTVRLVDIQGRRVQSFAVEDVDDALIRLDLAGLTPGVYIVQTLVDGRSMRTDKLIVTNEK